MNGKKKAGDKSQKVKSEKKKSKIVSLKPRIERRVEKKEEQKQRKYSFGIFSEIGLNWCGKKGNEKKIEKNKSDIYSNFESAGGIGKR